MIVVMVNIGDHDRIFFYHITVSIYTAQFHFSRLFRLQNVTLSRLHIIRSENIISKQ